MQLIYKLDYFKELSLIIIIIITIIIFKHSLN